MWNDLKGRRVAVIFDLPSTQWPIEGYPAWATFEGAADGLVRLRPGQGDYVVIVGAHTIRSIKPTGTVKPDVTGL